VTSSSSLSCPARYSSSSFGIVSNGLPLPNSAPWMALLEQGELEPRQLDGLLVRAGQPGEHDRAALADRGERGRDDLLGHHAHCDQRLIRADAPGELGDEFLRGHRVGRDVGGAETPWRAPA